MMRHLLLQRRSFAKEIKSLLHCALLYKIETYPEGAEHPRTSNYAHKLIFLQAVASIDLPEIFRPETTDVYDAKNIPRVIYCLHALSLFLYKLGKAPQMLDLTGKATFTAEQISAMRSALDDYGLPMPQFRRIGGKGKFL